MPLVCCHTLGAICHQVSSHSRGFAPFSFLVATVVVRAMNPANLSVAEVDALHELQRASDAMQPSEWQYASQKAGRPSLFFQVSGVIRPLAI